MNAAVMPSPKAVEELCTAASRIRPLVIAQRLWERYLSGQDRERLGSNFQDAYRRLGTVGIWAEIHGITPQRAVVEVAKLVGFLRDEDHQWLLRETGEIMEIEEAVQLAISSGDLVFLENPRRAYWQAQEIEIDWQTQNKSWEFFIKLARNAKAGKPVDRFTFGVKAHRDIVNKLKYRLVNMDGFPVDLTDLIDVVNDGTQQLKVPPKNIHIFEIVSMDTLSEWTPSSSYPPRGLQEMASILA